MRLAEHGQYLALEWQHLRDRWLATENLWDDVVRERFRQQFWDDLEITVPEVMKDLAELTELISAAMAREVLW